MPDPLEDHRHLLEVLLRVRVPLVLFSEPAPLLEAVAEQEFVTEPVGDAERPAGQVYRLLPPAGELAGQAEAEQDPTVDARLR